MTLVITNPQINLFAFIFTALILFLSEQLLIPLSGNDSGFNSKIRAYLIFFYIAGAAGVYCNNDGTDLNLCLNLFFALNLRVNLLCSSISQCLLQSEMHW